ncbi:hypothetical protein H0H81_004482 [Sphagnurus paluster]|uniref:AB hydrolase-1 domain-containing protein n=1 Tax=Sphagnurus paluster TaxID=117069 RepID=A0A9P7FYC1_9AGAR|nr:hypothetical protein H0H81_004482 [Sphagnurus paluster]
MSDEHILALAGGRRIAYAHSGNAASPRVLIFFHGTFGVGDASHPSPILAAKNIFALSPTLPGWGNSSPVPAGKPYHVCLAEDITALLTHLYPDSSRLQIYIGGGSFGTVPAQMLYGAPFDLFPLGRQVVGCLLIAPLSPFRYHKEYTKSMPLSTYFAIGPPAHVVPCHLVQRAAALALRCKTRTQAAAEKFIREHLFDKMGDGERAALRRWRQGKGRTEEDVVGHLARNMVQSVAKTWDGFVGMADVIHSDWGFRPDALDEEHTVDRPVLVVASTDDAMTPDGMARWLAGSYANARLRLISGGHLAAMFHLDSILDEFVI